MLRVLHVGFSSNPGGVENMVMNYYRHIDRMEFAFDFVDLYGDGLAFAEEIDGLGGRIHMLPNYKRHPIAASHGLGHILSEGHYDVMHVHMQSSANLMPVLAARRAGVAVACHCHSSSTPDGIVRKAMHALNVGRLRRMDVAKWACGVSAGRWMWGEEFDEGGVIPNAIELADYAPNEEKRAEMRKRAGFSSGDFVIGFVGRFGSEKNTFFLLDVLEESQKREGSYRLLTVGGNDLFEEFRAEAERRGLLPYWFSAGVQKSAADWYQAMDAFLLPSFFEGFPVTGVEAQASGLPCLFSDHVSREADVSGDCKFLPIGDGAERTWVDAVEIQAHSCRVCFAQLEPPYDLNNAVELLEQKYYSLCEGKGGSWL